MVEVRSQIERDSRGDGVPHVTSPDRAKTKESKKKKKGRKKHVQSSLARTRTSSTSSFGNERLPSMCPLPIPAGGSAGGSSASRKASPSISSRALSSSESASDLPV